MSGFWGTGKARSALVLLCAAALIFGWILAGKFEPRAEAQSETGTCPGAQEIDTFTGTGDQTSDTFETTTDSFRITYEATSTEDDPSLGSLNITVNDEEGLSVGNASQDGPGTGETFVNEPPGTYSLDISSIFLDYTITVEQCEGGGGSTNPGGGSTQYDDDQYDEDFAETTQYDDQTDGNPPLMNAGGPADGPVPAMPGGGCPPEFPKQQGGGCWRS